MLHGAQSAIIAAASLLVAAGTFNTCMDRVIDVDVEGQTVPLAFGGPRGEVSDDSKGVTFQHWDFTSFVTECEPEFKNYTDPSNIKLFQLLGKTLTLTVDYSNVSCACNMAIYLISAPAIGSDGQPSPGRGDYYCDANGVDGQYCPEIDLVEANKHGFRATPHKCTSVSSGTNTYNQATCDPNGCGVSANNELSPFTYGPGTEFSIDTRFPFNVSTYFEASGNNLTNMITILSQGSRQPVLLPHSDCNSAYLAELSQPLLEGMSLVFSYWGNEAEDMAWLDTPAWMDTPPCGDNETQTCSWSTTGAAHIMDIVVKVGPPMVEETTSTTEEPSTNDTATTEEPSTSATPPTTTAVSAVGSTTRPAWIGRGTLCVSVLAVVVANIGA